ncbi:hypothetical protein [Algoriphagus sp. NG3]|uniref:hypothetical protein n=1 Tax=unclassified Algoriphagus TaxID=2641541 RepID=UPI002A7FE064|nr:hypothetical protein [Algoriphagus sp. NG3]WPR76519.1 hypothetical protein SLW71_04055 [Algoriphagus sp. NG3]
MNRHAEKTSENKRQGVASNVPKLQSNGESAFQFLDNRPEAIAQRKLQKAFNSSQRVQQLKAYPETAYNSPKVIQKKPKGASIGKGMRKSGAANVISSMFIQQHMGNYKTAEKIAEQRAGTIPGSCHVISIDELSSIYAEINNRESTDHHAVAGNRVINPNTGNNQFQTANSYKIFEFSYDKKNRVKKGREIKASFYYDAIPNGAGGFILHHFDGVV